MSKYNIECGFISKLLETKDINLVKDLQIKPHFFGGEAKKIFNYLNEFYLKNGSLPTVRAFKQMFPKYQLEKYTCTETDSESIGTEETLKYWCDELRRRAKHNKIAENTEDIVKSLEGLDTDTAYDLMKKTVLYVENDIVESSSVDITKNTSERKLIYLKRKESEGMIGIPMGIQMLDYILKGMQEKQLTTMIAGTGVGKTWFEVLIGANAVVNGYKVLQFVTEMSEEVMQDRYEAMLFGKLIGDFNYSKFKAGSFSPQEENMYFDFLDNRLPRLEQVIIEQATGVSSVASKIDQYQPDLILIDGAYLMEDERNAKDDWLRVAHITRDLKNICKLKAKPIFINSQADSTTSKRTGPELDNIGYAKAIGQDSDVVMALFRDEQMLEDHEMKVKILKQREGTLGNVMLNWDFSTMNFDAIYSNVDKKEDNKTSKEKSGVIKV